MSSERSDSVPGVLAAARVKTTDPFALLLEAAGAAAGVGAATQILGGGALAIVLGLILGAAGGWLLTYSLNVVLVWFGTIRRLRLALDRCLEKRVGDWEGECDRFRRLAREAWEKLDAGFVEKGFFGLTAGVDSLSPLVSDAPWPEDEDDEESEAVIIAEGALRDFAKRLYLKDASRVFSSAENLHAFEALRQELAILARRWARQLEAGDETSLRLAETLRSGLGSTGLETIKLMRYVEEAKAEAIGNKAPDFSPWETLHRALSNGT